jgi:AcrR family transcriptional regulator/DNA-binding MarR family transcriptional regulator
VQESHQRSRILEAMAELVAEHGSGSVTVRLLAARAGVSRGVFYELFVDREHCFLAAFELGVERAGARMLEAYTAQPRWRDGIRMALARLLSFLEQEPALGRLCVVHALGGGLPVLRRRAQVLEQLCEVVHRGRLEGRSAREPPAVIAEGVVGAVLSVIQNRLLEHDLADATSGSSAAGLSASPSGSAAPSGSTLLLPGSAAPRGSVAQSVAAPLMELFGALMSLILLPYLGAAAAYRELTRSPPRVGLAPGAVPPGAGNASLPDRRDVRLTYRTARVLSALAERAGVSNREVAKRAGIVDQGQISKLLRRLESLGLIERMGEGTTRGAPNSWRLTVAGERIERTVAAEQALASRSERERSTPVGSRSSARGRATE